MAKLTLKEVVSLGYDSVAEYSFHQRNQHLHLITDKPYKYTFYDDTGIAFKAYPDFWHSPNTAIEFKDCQLNTQTDKLTAKSKLKKVQEFKGKKLLIDQLKYDWNHSMYKQSKVQSTLASLGFKMLVVFSDSTKITVNNRNKMDKLNLQWCFESDYFADKQEVLH